MKVSKIQKTKRLVSTAGCPKSNFDVSASKQNLPGSKFKTANDSILAEIRRESKTNIFKDSRMKAAGDNEQIIDEQIQHLVKKISKNFQNNLDQSSTSTQQLTHGGIAIDSLSQLKLADSSFFCDNDTEVEESDLLAKKHFGRGLSIYKPLKQIYSEIIQKSKIEKAKRAATNEEQSQRLEDLDLRHQNLYDSILSLDTRPTKKQACINTAVSGNPDVYDRLLQSLAYDAQAEASTSIMSQDQITLQQKKSALQYDIDKQSTDDNCSISSGYSYSVDETTAIIDDDPTHESPNVQIKIVDADKPNQNSAENSEADISDLSAIFSNVSMHNDATKASSVSYLRDGQLEKNKENVTLAESFNSAEALSSFLRELPLESQLRTLEWLRAHERSTRKTQQSSLLFNTLCFLEDQIQTELQRSSLFLQSESITQFRTFLISSIHESPDIMTSFFIPRLLRVIGKYFGSLVDLPSIATFSHESIKESVTLKQKTSHSSISNFPMIPLSAIEVAQLKLFMSVIDWSNHATSSISKLTMMFLELSTNCILDGFDNKKLSDAERVILYKFTSQIVALYAFVSSYWSAYFPLYVPALCICYKLCHQCLLSSSCEISTETYDFRDENQRNELTIIFELMERELTRHLQNSQARVVQDYACDAILAVLNDCQSECCRNETLIRIVEVEKLRDTAVPAIQLGHFQPGTIRMLTPIYVNIHDPQSQSSLFSSTSKLSSVRKLKKEISRERKCVVRQLRQDMESVNKIREEQEMIQNAARQKERYRLRRILELEKEDYHKMTTSVVLKQRKQRKIAQV